MLQQDRLDIVLGQPRLAQRAQQEDVRVGAAGDRDALAHKVGDRLDVAVRAGNEGGPLRLGIDIDRLDRQPAGTADQGGAAGRRAEVDRTGAQELERRSEEHTSELQSLMRISYAVFCLKK